MPSHLAGRALRDNYGVTLICSSQVYMPSMSHLVIFDSSHRSTHFWTSSQQRLFHPMMYKQSQRILGCKCDLHNCLCRAGVLMQRPL